MARTNRYCLYVDIKEREISKTPKFVQYDSAQLVFRIYDNGRLLDLSPFTGGVVSHKKPSGEVVSSDVTIGEVNGRSVVTYDYTGEEMDEVGLVETELTLFSENPEEQVSILPFMVEIVESIRNNTN